MSGAAGRGSVGGEGAAPNRQHVLIVDDDPDVCEFIRMVVEDCGLPVTVAEDHTLFRDYFARCRPSVIISDLQMPGLDGVELLRYLAERRSSARVILLSGMDARVLATARRLGDSLGLAILGALQKPVAVQDLKALLERAVRDTRTVTVEDLAAAVAGKQILAHYQPKVSLGNGTGTNAMAVEALARWEHPVLGRLAPAAFIPLAEKSGLIGGLTDRMLDVAFGQLRDWRKAGIELSLAVNLAPHLLTDLALPDRIAERARGHGIDACTVLLEVTETGLMEDAAKTMDILTRLRLKGFELSIDDFGTGYSSLVQLYRMPFSEVKIDKSFVMELDDNEEARVIVRAVVDLGHNLSLSVCAEGVETDGAWRLLRSLGCDRAQGYRMAHPMPPAELPAWLDGWPERRRSLGGG